MSLFTNYYVGSLAPFALHKSEIIGKVFVTGGFLQQYTITHLRVDDNDLFTAVNVDKSVPFEMFACDSYFRARGTSHDGLPVQTLE